MRNPTMKEIAAAAGVHQTTISRALRGHPSIPAARAAQLRTLAERMGYVPDPMMSALAAYRTTRRPATFHSTMVWLNPSLEHSAWKYHRSYRTIFEAASKRSYSLGFQLEVLSLPGPGAQMARLDSMLAARNVSGVIVGPAPLPNARLNAIDWKRFSAIRIGLSMDEPRLHAVTSHHSDTMLRVMQELHARGYRRPGLFLSSHHDRRMNWNFSSTFLGAQARLFPSGEHIAPNLFAAGRADMGELAQWLKQHRPDVLVAVGEAALLPTLKAMGLRVPRDIGLAALGQPNEGDSLCGVVENNEQIGTTAVNSLVAMINRQERGIPEHPQTLQITPLWHDGGTLRQAASGQPAKAPRLPASRKRTR